MIALPRLIALKTLIDGTFNFNDKLVQMLAYYVFLILAMH
jgi:hypothetical protein